MLQAPIQVLSAFALIPAATISDMGRNATPAERARRYRFARAPAVSGGAARLDLGAPYRVRAAACHAVRLARRRRMYAKATAMAQTTQTAAQP